jgi:hypothetical protein
MNLRDIIEHATPGPWRRDGAEGMGRYVYTAQPSPGADIAEVLYNDEDAEFIATFDPAMVGRLLDVVEAAQTLARYFPSHGVAEVTVDAMPCVDLARALADLDAERTEVTA